MNLTWNTPKTGWIWLIVNSFFFLYRKKYFFVQKLTIKINLFMKGFQGVPIYVQCSKLVSFTVQSLSYKDGLPYILNTLGKPLFTPFLTWYPRHATYLSSVIYLYLRMSHLWATNMYTWVCGHGETNTYKICHSNIGLAWAYADFCTDNRRNSFRIRGER